MTQIKKFKDFLIESKILSESGILLENRIDFVKNLYSSKGVNTSHDSTALHQDPAAIVDHFAETADPTKKKVYTQWAVARYNDGQTRQEDAHRLKPTLELFDKWKHKLPEKDINKYKTIGDVEKAVEPYKDTVGKVRLVKSWEIPEHPGQEKKYEDDRIKIYRLHTKAASQDLYGGATDEKGKTDWCTSFDDKHCMFDAYKKKGNIHVIHDKKTGELYQYHAHDNQFMDRYDDRIKDKDFLDLAPHLHKAWEQDHSLVS